MKKFLLHLFFSALLSLSCFASIAQEASALELAKAHIYRKYPSLQNESSVGWIITDEIKSKHNNVTHLYLRQAVDGVEIINVNLSIAILNSKVIHMVGKVLDQIERPAKGMSASLSGEQAVQASATHLGLTVGALQRVAQSNAKASTVFYNAQLSMEPIPVKQVLWLSSKNELHLAYDLSIYPPGEHEWWSLRVDAQSGEILEQGNWVVKCSFDEPRIHENPTFVHSRTKELSVNSGGQYNVFAMPVESPNHGERSLVSSPFNPTASPFGWHDTNGMIGAEFTITRGNNVYAYEDADANNLPGYSPNGGSTLVFDHNYSSNGNPDNYRDASITNLFYWNNIIHDVLYKYGFDEASGSFQQRNYTGSGLGNDYVLAEDMDGSGTNNANFGTPPDGSSPRMQMFLWLSGGSAELVINTPIGVDGSYAAIGAGFGPSLIGNSKSGELVLMNDATANPTLACGTLTNGVALNGKIALVDRGVCSFASKVKAAQDAGAIAVIVINSAEAGDNLITMGNADPPLTITIPSMMVGYTTGSLIKAALPGVTVTLVDNRFYLSGGFDNGIITHEYGHGVSNRLTGGPSNADCLVNAEQMGEGWSDYLGLMLTMKEGDAGEMSRGIGTYAIGEPISGNGIRPAPYTTNIAVNAYTYASVADENNISQPHGIGFIWCSMLWDMTWKFIERYGLDPDIQNGTGGNNMALQLVMDGMKLQPCSPGFVDGRDAILLADQINNGGANQDIIWEAFARRGLGASANQGSSGDRFDGVEAFDVPLALQMDAEVDLAVAQAGDELTYEIDIQNIFSTDQSNVFIESTIPQGASIVEGSLSEGSIFTEGVVQFSTELFSGLSSISLSYKVTIDSETPLTQTLFYDGQEAGASKWMLQNLVGTSGWRYTAANVFDGSKVWFAPNANTASDLVLRTTFPIEIENGSKLAFWHSFDTESAFDGGVVEISNNGGSTWMDADAAMIQNGYNDFITSDSYGRKAFAGRSGGYIKTIIDLSQSSGSSILLRFRFLSDSGVGVDGWRIDNVYIYTGEEVVLSAETCLTYDGIEDPICSDTNSTVFDYEINCQPFAGILRTNTDLTLLSEFCEENLSQLNFNVNFGTANINSPGNSYGYAFILSDQVEPYVIEAVNTSGQFLVENIPAGQYKMWGISYAISNLEANVLDYVSSKSNMQAILDDMAIGEICAAVQDKYADGTTALLNKVAQCVLGVTPLDSASFIKYYPNPSDGLFSLQIIDQIGKMAEVSIYNLSGQIFIRRQFQLNSQDYRTNIGLHQLSAGLYLLDVQIDDHHYTGRLIVE
mgnify:CR=1 FL=1